MSSHAERQSHLWYSCWILHMMNTLFSSLALILTTSAKNTLIKRKKKKKKLLVTDHSFISSFTVLIPLLPMTVFPSFQTAMQTVDEIKAPNDHERWMK